MRRNMALRKRKDGTARTARTRLKLKLWVASVKTDSTRPPEGLFTKKASTIAKTLASKRVSPKGPTSGLRMLTYFINRAGKGLSHRAELEKAKGLLSKRIHGAKASGEERNRNDSKVKIR